MTRFEKILQQLHAHGVEFILIGGMAARVWGSSRLTDDIDIVYQQTHRNSLQPRFAGTGWLFIYAFAC
jgi:predicted nucleotidyltransferase